MKIATRKWASGSWWLSLLIVGLALPGMAQAQVVISQVYGGGGNPGTTYKNDFIELHNNGSTAVD